MACGKIILLLCAVFYGTNLPKATAQALPINGDTIIVNMEAEVQIMFPAPVKSFSTDPVDSRYRIWAVKTGIYFIAGAEDYTPVTLTVSEGERSHRFILVFKKIITNSEAKLYYDFSTVKKLALHISQTSLAKSPGRASGFENSQFDNDNGSTVKKTVRETLKSSTYQAQLKNNKEDSAGKKLPQLSLKKDDAVSSVVANTTGQAVDAKARVFKKEKAAQKEIDKKYVEVIVEARYAMERKEYRQAHAAYKRALEYKPGDLFATHQLQKITVFQQGSGAESEAQTNKAALNGNNASAITLLEEETSTAENIYQAAIRSADTFFKAGDYGNAKIQYTKALAAFKSEWPQNQLRAIDKIQNEFTARAKEDNKTIVEVPKSPAGNNSKKDSILQAAEIRKKYNLALANGKSSYIKQDFSQARIFYEEALNLQPLQPEPKNQLKVIHNKLEDIARETAFNENYDRILQLADSQIIAKDYQLSLVTYKEASILKPLESYPKKQIKYINFEMARLEKKKKDETEEQYKEALTRADKAVADKQYEEAKNLYTEALGIHGDNEYAKRRLEIISYQLERERLEKLSREAVKQPVPIKKSKRKRSA